MTGMNDGFVPSLAHYQEPGLPLRLWKGCWFRIFGPIIGLLPLSVLLENGV